MLSSGVLIGRYHSSVVQILLSWALALRGTAVADAAFNVYRFKKWQLVQ